MKLRAVLVFTFVSLGYPAFSQDNPYKRDFESFKNAKEEEFSLYREQINKEYSVFLRQSWEWFSGNPAIPTPQRDTTPSPPVIAPKEDRLPATEPTLIIPKNTIPSPLPAPEPSPISPIDESISVLGPVISFDFYGTECKVHVGNCSLLNLQNLRESSVANMWDELCKENSLLRDCLTIKDSLDLCDWAYIRMCSNLADAIYPNKKNEAAVLESYVLIQSGFDVLFGRDNDSKTLSGMVSANSRMYERPYYIVNGKEYYTLRDIPGDGLYILGHPYPETKPFRLEITQEMLFDRKLSKQHSIQSEKYPFLKLPFCANENLIGFYEGYPSSQVGSDFSSKWRFYANAPASREIKEYLYPTLKRVTSGMTELEAVSILLDFVQTGFEYEYDSVVWGHDRAFFPDETLFYPYSDCEDRSIFLSRIIRDVLGLKVILVYSPGHLFTAVHFNCSVNGDYLIVDNVRYTICDPTYIHAPVGVSMKGVDKQKLTVVLL